MPENHKSQRKQKFLSIGRKKGFIKDEIDGNKMIMRKNILLNLKQQINKNRIIIPVLVTAVALILLTLFYL